MDNQTPTPPEPTPPHTEPTASTQAEPLQPVVKPSHRIRNILNLLAIALIGAGLIAGYISTKNLHQAGNNLSNDSIVLTQEEDASNIVDAVSEFESDNDGAGPTKILALTDSKIAFCGSGQNCPGPDSLTIATLQYYRAKQISIVAYKSNLTVPSNKVVYVVNNATCNNTSTGIGASTDVGVVVLYAIKPSDSPLEQKCE